MNLLAGGIDLIIPGTNMFKLLEKLIIGIMLVGFIICSTNVPVSASTTRYEDLPVEWCEMESKFPNNDNIVTSTPIETITPTNDLFVMQDSKATVRYLNLRVMLGKTYLEDYSDANKEASDRVSYVDYPFINTWSIGFTESFTNLTNMPIDRCKLSNTTLCTDAACGKGCNNDTDNDVHHKNSIKNLNKVRKDIKDDNYDLFITLVSTPMCGIWGSDHLTNTLGVSYINDNYTFLSNSSSISTNVRVRIMQHEICHMFGCNDGLCTKDSSCIMNGGYDGISLYTSNVWCSSCKKDFNPNAH